MKIQILILFFTITISSFGQVVSVDDSIGYRGYMMILGKETHRIDTSMLAKIDPTWIKKIEVLKSEEERYIYGNGNGIVLIYPKTEYFEKISLLLNTIPNNQEQIDRQTLDSIYVKALNSRIDLQLSSGWKFIEPNEQTERIKNNFDQNSVYKFLSFDELFDYAYKHGKTLKLYRVTHKQISKDTIDINFGDLALKVKKGIFFKNGLHFREANYSLACGGTNGYIPDFRFVYDKQTKTWKIIGGRYKSPE